MPFRKSFIRQSLLLALGVTLANGAFAKGPPFKPGEVVVKGAPDMFTEYEVIKYLPLTNNTVIKVTGKERAALNKLRASGRKAKLNYLLQKTATVNDPLYSYQWHFEKMNAQAAWDISTGAGVKVAVLDTGLRDNRAVDGVNTCSTGHIDIVNSDNDPSDGDGHGTHVSGTISQVTNNGTGVAGLAHGACVIPVKVLDDRGSGTFTDVAEGILHAIGAGAQVINMSLGADAQYGHLVDADMDAAMVAAEAAEVLVVVAAGNDGNRSNVSYPASYATALSVGATDYNNVLVGYSNSGTGLDVVAPGGDTSTDQDGDGYVDGVLQETFNRRKAGYYFFQGTSMAAPHVAATAALVLATPAYNGLSASELRNHLMTQTLEVGGSSLYGSGLVQADLAVAGGGTGEPPANVPPVAGFEADCTDLTCDFDASVLSSDTDGTIVNYAWNIAGDAGFDSVPVISNHTFPGEGAYTVTLTVTDNDGAQDTSQQEVFVFAPSGVDADGDGYSPPADCNDNDPTIHPGARDRGGKKWRDGVDNDCNGVIDG